MIDPRGGNEQPLRAGAVVLEEIIELIRGGGDHTVGESDDLILGAQSRRARPRLVGPMRGILHPAQRVERVSQRKAKRLFDQHPRPARQPVVGVHHIESLPIAPRPVDDPVPKGADVFDEFRDRQRLSGTGIDVDDAVAGHRLHHLRLVWIGAAGEHDRVYAHRSHGRGQLVHVDVHSAGVADPRLVERRGMHGNKGDLPDHANVPSMR